MNTKKVYIGNIYKVSSVDYDPLLGPNIFLDYEKRVLMISRRNIFGRKYMMDLNTGERYCVKLSDRIGTLYVSKSSLKEFNDLTNNKQARLSKRKVKTIGNFLLKSKEK